MLPRRIITIRKSLVMFSCLILSVVILQQLSLKAQTVYFNFSVHIGSFINVQSHNAVEDASYRIQFFKGKCLSSLNGSLAVALFCEPNQVQSFTITLDGKLMLERTGECLQRSSVSLPYPGFSLKFGNCAGAAKFDVVDGFHLQLVPDTQGVTSEQLCVTPAFLNNTNASYTIEAISDPKQGSLVCLMPCQEYSKIHLKPECTFMEDRKALLQEVSSLDPSCDYPACALNKRAPPVKIRPLHGPAQRCQTISDCVTVVTKTARRPHLVARLAQSFRDVKGYDLPMIVIDDGGEPFSPDIMRNLSRFQNLNYIVSNDTDLGIALGRTLAVQLVKTKYFFLLDDDSVVSNRTNIEEIVEMLETTDASLIGGRITDSAEFAGLLQFGRSDLDGKRQLQLYKNACVKINDTIDQFPRCIRCDVTTNVFMARTKDVLEVGGWSKELKIVEHKDLFLRLKAAQKKVVYCPDFQILNVKQKKVDRDAVYQAKRFARFRFMKSWFNNIWTVDDFTELFFQKMSTDILARIMNDT